MRTSKEEWDKIYETVCKIAKKYEILNLPVNENCIFVYYNSKKIFDTEQDFKNRESLVYEIEKTLEKERSFGTIEIKISDDLEKRIIIERK
ncbi:MAG: hypothetical protein QXP77_03125 [Candidatus Aenigmatarchaeota archaeon]